MNTFEKNISSILNPVEKEVDIIELSLSIANKIRVKNNLPELKLDYWEEDKHPRGRGGKFASGGGGGGNSGGGNDNEVPNLGYNREEIRNKIKKEDSRKRLHNFLTGLKYTAIIGGTAGLAVSGHPILATALAGGYAAHKMKQSIEKNAARVTAKYATKAVAGTARHVIINPIKRIGHGVAEIGRGVGEGLE